MGGDAGVESTVEVGSTFWFTARLGRGTPLPASITHSPLTGRRVLVADDVPATRSAIASMLVSLGLRAEVVESGAEALARMQAEDDTDPFDAVLLDADLPQVSGRQTARKLYQLTLRNAPACVLVVGCGQPNEPAEARESAGVLAKPVTASSLHDCLLNALRFSSDAPSTERTSSAAEDLLRSRYTGARILLAEDNPINQEVALGLLQAVGLNVDLAVDGEKALAAAEAAAYDVILLDVQMPVMDGLEAARRIRTLPAHRTTPILAMTANAFGEDRAACIAAGMNEHVTKPVDVQAMYAALLRWLPQDVRPQPSAPRTTAAADANPAPVKVPAPVAAIPLVDRLAGIPGFDAELGLRFCGNREESLLLVLQQFDALYAKSATTLADDVAAGNRREAHRLAHSLNGASGVIGAERIQKLAAALEVALATRRNDAEVTTAAEQLQFALAALIQALRERVEMVVAAPVVAQKPASSPVSAALDAGLDELEGLLGDADFGAGTLYRQHADAIRRLLGSSTQTFEQHLRAYDYLQALECLRAARARVMAT